MMETASKSAVILPLTGEKTSFFVQTAWIFLFAALTAAGAQVEIPHQPVPYTLQTFFVLLGAAFLGSRNGSLSQLLYLGIGLAGGPVFSGGSFGLARLIGPSGGYLLSFPLASIVVGYIVQRHSGYLWTLVGMFLGLVIVFTCGATFLDIFYLHNFKESFISGFLIFSWWDLLKLSAAAAIYNEVAKRYKKVPV
ncbi:MAG: biotin transporter BioY [Bacteroidota bacterium]